MASNESDDEFVVECEVQNLSTVVSSDRETTREVNEQYESLRDVNNTPLPNMAAPNASADFQTLLVANMQQNTNMIQKIADSFMSFQKQMNSDKPQAKVDKQGTPAAECSNKVTQSQDNSGKRKSVVNDNLSPDEQSKKQKNINNDEETPDGFDDLANYSDVESDQESGDEDNETTKLLDELQECFGSSEKCGDNILDKLAKVTNEGLRSKLDSGKIKDATEKYLRPKNVENLITPRVNNEIWRHLSRGVRNQDLKLSRTQSLVCKAIVPQLQLLDLIMKKQNSKEKITPKEIARLAMDSLKIMTFAYCDLSYRRREIIIKPGKNEEFQSLCSHDHPVTDKLFGDDLEKTVESIVKRNRLGYRISGGRSDRGKFVPGKPWLNKSRKDEGRRGGEGSTTGGSRSFLCKRFHKNKRRKDKQ